MATNRELFVCGFAKVLEEQQHVDVQLKAKDSDELGKSVLAHKIILSARSKVFKMMLDSDEIKASTKLETINFSELKHTALEALVEFIYSDGSKLSTNGINHMWQLYYAAHKYEIPHLRDLCRITIIEYCRRNLTSAFTVFNHAQNHFDKALIDATFGIIKEKIRAAISHPKFKDFIVKNPDHVVEIMKALCDKNC